MFDYFNNNINNNNNGNCCYLNGDDNSNRRCRFLILLTVVGMSCILTYFSQSPEWKQLIYFRDTKMKVKQSTIQNNNNNNNNNNTAISITTPITTTATTTSSSFINNKKHMAPNLFLAGVQKGGTTSVTQWLFQHPSNKVCIPRIYKEDGDLYYYDKEVHFFDETTRYEQGFDFYVKRFDHCSSTQIIMDGTPGTQFLSNRIKQFYLQYKSQLLHNPKDIKVMMILREPISRELSWYNHMKFKFIQDPNHQSWQKYVARPIVDATKITSTTTTTTTTTNVRNEIGEVYTFDEYIENVWYPKVMKNGTYIRGYYVKYIKEWMEWIPRNQILLLSQDEMITNPNQFLQRISDFLNLQQEYIDEDGTQHYEEALSSLGHSNKKESPSKTKIPSCQIQNNLTQYFESKNQELYDFLEQYPGPSMEQRPFQKFQLGRCVS